MTMDMKQRLEAMLDGGRDGALLRFSLGELLFKEGDTSAAAEHLAKAVELDPEYAAAWKLYGQALVANDDLSGAIEAFDQGISVAEVNGNNQAAREMQVFRKRAQKQLS